MLKKLSIFTILALASSFGQASQKQDHEKPEQEETAPAAKRPKIVKAASGSSEAGKATTSLAASPTLDTDQSASSAAATSVAAEAPMQKQVASGTRKSMLDPAIRGQKPLQAIILGYLESEWKEVKTLKRNPGSVKSIAWSKNGKELAGGWGGNPYIWNTAINQFETKPIINTMGQIRSLSLSSDGLQLATATERTSFMRIWNVETGQIVTKLYGHNNWVSSLTFSSDDKYIASGSWDNTIKIWDAATGKVVKTLTGHSDLVYSITWSPDSQLLASGSWDKTIKIWDTSTWKEVKTVTTGHSDSIFSIAWSKNGKYLASGSRDGTIKIWDTTTFTEAKILTGHCDPVSSVAWSPDGKQLASGSWDKTIKIWDPITGTCINTLGGHQSDVTSVSYSPDGDYLASGSNDETIKIWQTQAEEIKLADAASKSCVVTEVD